MKTPVRLRLSFSHLFVLIIGMIMAGVLVWLAVEQIYLTTQRDNLLAQAQLTAAALEGSPVQSSSPDFYSQTTNVTPGIHTRLLDQGGAVVIGVPFPEGQDPVQVPPSEDSGFAAAEDLLLRPEIQSALNGAADTAIRQIVAVDGTRVLYAAAPVYGEDNQIINLVYLAAPLPPRGLPGDLTLQLIGAVLIAGILASILGILLAGGIARPLERLDRAASAVSEGDLHQHLSTEVNIKELKNLSKTFNLMTESLLLSDQTKNAFIADVTHELRTPLTVIKGTVETLEDGALDDKSGRGKLLHSMNQETNRLIRLVNDLLVLTRSDARALALDIQNFDLFKTVQSRCENMESLANKKGVDFTIKENPVSNPASYWVSGDQNRTSQILDNLLDNALRYAPENSKIILTLENHDETVLCSISDQGKGIPIEHLPLIFERFYRVDKSRDRETGGSGLGLSIARALIQAQGGDIQIESQVGIGTTVQFHLPSGKVPVN